ncbi:phospholipase D family protein [Priestia megaterium]|uniref:phospholipase D family protein n=1 Tax=Priestia megaterium TaxID=1404 RepID=UPI001C2119CD|nr:phospholipase D family protein [Priestia megaterium]MBU8754120.1 phospholipase D family protein [Priestia megaterium]
MSTNIEAYFSRPGDTCEIKDRLLVDIKHAKERIYIAMAYISDQEVIKSLESSHAEKKFVLNAQVNTVKGFGWQSVVKLGGDVEKITYKNKSSLMHHKFWIIDDIVWVGSFNTTDYAADIHWENMLRIEDPHILSKYLSEFNRMFILGKALEQANEPYVNYFEKKIESPEGKIHYKIDTVCLKCKDKPHPGGPSYEPLDGIICTDVLGHYYFNVEHMVFENPEFVGYSEVEYQMKCDLEVLLSHRPIGNKGVCELCKGVHNRQSLISTNFKVTRRELVEEELVDATVSRGKEYLFCTKCIFDALTNHEIYEKE